MLSQIYVHVHNITSELIPSQQQDVDPTLVHGRYGWSNVAVGMPTFAPCWVDMVGPMLARRMIFDGEMCSRLANDGI